MFGFHKKKETIFLTKSEFTEYWNSSSERMEHLAKENVLEEGFHQQELRRKKQDAMLEEILELSDDTSETVKRLSDQAKKQGQEEKELIDIICKYDEYLMKAMELTPDNIDSDLVWKMLDRELMLGQLGRIRGERQPVCLAQMEVIGTEDTQDQTKNHLVKETIMSGWIYKGKVIRKAKVIVWKYKEM